MPLIFTRNGFLGDFEFERQRVEALHRDLTDLANGKLPSAKDLESSPVIDGYIISGRSAQCLVGYTAGHPILGDRLIQTSDLWVLSFEYGWARTLSRYYRLGRALAEKKVPEQ